MGMWLLRTLMLKFKGKMTRFIVVLLVIFFILNVLLLKRGKSTRNEREKRFKNTNVENSISSHLGARSNAVQQPGEHVGSNLNSRLGKHLEKSRRKGDQLTNDGISDFDLNHADDTGPPDFVWSNLFITKTKNKAAKPSININTSYGSLEAENNYLSDESKTIPYSNYCPELFISHISKDWQYGRCKPHKPTQKSCLFAEQLYFRDKNPIKCKSPKTEEICSIKILDTKESLESRVHVLCDRSLCSEKWFSNSLAVWTLEPRNGEIERLKSFSSILEMQKALPRMIVETLTKEIYFVVLKCSRKQDGESITQLVPIDPQLTIKKSKKSKNQRSKTAINVNILLLDSVSRSHFYRSLPKTIDLFKKWSSSDSAPAYIFDFELFQAIHGHTAENTHALFTGKSLPPHLEDEFPPVEIGAMFGRFAKAGYQTLWQEDLCWKGSWGLMTDMSAYEWEEMTLRLKENFIDSIGLTHSSCEILMAYKLITPFNGPRGDQICYNGKFQHEYLLNYTLDTLDALQSSVEALPLLSYMSLSVGHDDIGRRIQTLDQSLTEYLEKVGKDESTITIVLADHGNTYTEYTVAILEGRFEMFHPSLFIVLPKNVARMLGNEAMRALRANQRRLVNMYDLHHTLTALAGPLNEGRVSPQGIFTPISVNRTCDDIELRTPNLCVCEGWDSPTTNDTLKISLVEFAIGQLNNLMDDKLLAKRLNNEKFQFPLLKSCRRLIPVQFENVRERNTNNGLLRTSMDIHVKSVKEIPGKTETFHVEIESTETPDSNSMNLRLVHFDRMSAFEKYKTCSDPGVSPLFCICSNPPVRHSIDKLKRKIDFNPDKENDLLDTEVSVEILDRKECLLLVRRHHRNESFSFEFANLCLDSDISLFVNVVDPENLKLSRKLPMKITLRAGSMRFAFTARKDVSYWDSTFEITTNIIAIRKKQ